MTTATQATPCHAMPSNAMPTATRAIFRHATPPHCMRITPCVAHFEARACAIRFNAFRRSSVIH
eukprot:10277493-Lingulodinium_polyedra.AAC.1